VPLHRCLNLRSRTAFLRWNLAIVVALMVSRAHNARAQEARSFTGSVRVELDNDLFAVRGGGPPPDYDYTAGGRVSIARPVAPAFLARALRAGAACSDTLAARQGCLLSGISIGQEIYTPRHNTEIAVDGDRPHAAWLFGALGIVRLQGATLQSLAVQAGITGPPALGEEVQNGVHRLLQNHRELGWDHQLPTRLGIAADYDASSLIGPRSSRGPSRFVALTAGATAGTLRRSVRVGAAVDYGLGSTGAPSADAPLVSRPGRFYLISGYEQSLVMRDVFVEGSGAVQGAARLPWVGEVYGGAGWRFGSFALEYREVSTGRQYRAEPGRHAYGTIAVSDLR
jgi:lipid A 3-O-deacylase